MFIRRLYYNSAGEVLHGYMMQGAVKPVTETPEQEAARLGLVDWIVMQWDEPEEEIEKCFEESYGRVRVAIDGEDHALVFDFSPLPVEETPEQDMKNALSILGVEVE